MAVRNSPRRWGSLAQLLHWVVVALILVQYTLGLIAGDLPLGMKKLATLARHKSFGLTILGLAVLRLLWRWTNPTPPLPNDLKPYERVLAHITHAALYVLLFAALLQTHHLLAWALAAVVVLHVAAALKHHYVLKDDVLRRMLPFTKTP